MSSRPPAMPAAQLRNRRTLGPHHHYDGDVGAEDRPCHRVGCRSCSPRVGSIPRSAPLKAASCINASAARGTPRRQSARSSCGTRPRADVASPSGPFPGCHETQYRENVGSGLLRVASDRTDHRGNKAEAGQGRGHPASRSSSRVPEGSGSHKSTPTKNPRANRKRS